MKIILDCCDNHLGKISIIKHMIKLASGYADYVKFQLYDPVTLNPDYPNFSEKYTSYAITEITQIEMSIIMEYCKKYKLLPMFTIFNYKKLELLESYRNINFALKIASPNAYDVEYIKKVHEYYPDKLILVSTGMIPVDRIHKIREQVPKAKLLYCISKYPTPLDEVNYEVMKNFDGFSDHTLGFETSMKVGTMDLGFYERHFSLSRNLPGKDHVISVVPEDLERLVQNLRFKETCMNYMNRWKGGN